MLGYIYAGLVKISYGHQSKTWQYGTHLGLFGCRLGLGALAQACASDPKCLKSKAQTQASFPCHDPNMPTVH